MSPKYKILSIDGGGIRGVIPCAILKYIEKQTDEPISSLFNLIAGTSTGGIIALGLTMAGANKRNAYSAAQMLNLYIENGSSIFPGRSKDILSRLSEKIFSKPFDSRGIETVLNQYFGESVLKNALTEVLVTTYDIESGRPFYFSSRLAKLDTSEDFPIRTVARSTSAAPTYFQPSIVNYKEGDDVAFVDGGVFANNPSILAYAEAKELWNTQMANIKVAPEKNSKAFGAKASPSDHDLPFYLLSIGTGYTTNPIDGLKANKFRNKDWFEPLMTNIFMRSVAESTHYTMQYLLPSYSSKTNRYQRLDFEIQKEISNMEDASAENIERLLEAADRYIENNKSILDSICEIIA
jgi:uncharacterized protein